MKVSSAPGYFCTPKKMILLTLGNFGLECILHHTYSVLRNFFIFYEYLFGNYNLS